MQRYIQLLIEDFKRAEERGRPDASFSVGYEGLQSILHALEEDEPVPAKELVGGSFEELPPASRRDTEQIQQMPEAMLNALSDDGVGISFPCNGISVNPAYR